MSAEIFRQSIEKPSDRVIVALDGMTWGQAIETICEVSPYVGMGKANSIAQKVGWQYSVDTLAYCGVGTMLDQKYKDIPSTMENHLREATECGPKLITVFADNTKEALEGAVRGRDAGRENLPASGQDGGLSNIAGILGVTVLTSIDSDSCVSIYGDTPEKKVVQFAHTALEAGLDGIVCSPKELKLIRGIAEFDDLLTVIPGITPEWTTKPTDQKRISTPTEAIQDGADFLVIGRAITKPPAAISRVEAAQRIAQELAEAA